MEDSSSSSTAHSQGEVYLPEANTVDLKTTERAYDQLEYLSIEWPSQSVLFISKDELVVGMNASEESGESSSLLILNFSDCDNYCELDAFRAKQIKSDLLNRLAYIENKELIVGISDNSLSIFNREKFLKKIEGSFDYGLTVFNNEIFAASDGAVKIYDIDLNLIRSIDLHSKEINSLVVKDSILYSSSNDKTVKIYDLKKDEIIYSKEFDSDINSVALSPDGTTLVFGDDEGKLYLLKNKKILETIEWHRSPINSVRFIDNDNFISISNEQVALWDRSMEDEWDYHKYLFFVHQGAKEYRDATVVPGFEDEYLILTTSMDGLCFFKPVSEISEK